MMQEAGKTGEITPAGSTIRLARGLPSPQVTTLAKVLEDNLRVPSGVSYMLVNRVLTNRVFGEPAGHGAHRADRRAL
jgi:hypothetical protein